MRKNRVIAAACVVVLAAGCGSGHKVASVTPVNAATDRTAAQAINLTTADLPGWTSSPNQKSTTDQAMGARLAACAGAADPSTVDVVDVSSPDFDSGNAEVSSDVTTVHTAAQATQDLDAMRSSKLSPCIQQLAKPYLQSLLPAGATIGGIEVERLNLSHPPPNSFSYRLSVTVSSPNQGSVVVDSDSIGFLVGRAEIELDDTQTGGLPDPALEQRLLSVLVGRAQHPLG